jgi:sporulation protein YlmC with PRC-barrel domain
MNTLPALALAAAFGAVMSVSGAVCARTGVSPDTRVSQETRTSPATPHGPDSQTTSEPPSHPPAHSGSADSVAAQRNAGTATRVASVGTTVDATEHRASKMMGMGVQTPAGDKLGNVKDVILDNNGMATHVVVSYGGALGVGTKLAALPWSTANSLTQGNKLVIDRARLEGAPTFEENRWPDMTSHSWSAEADSYWQGPGSPTHSATAPDNDNSAPSSSQQPKDRG